MDIQINERYKISSDPMNVILQEVKYPKEGSKHTEPRWENVKYYADITQACLGLMKIEGNQSDEVTLTGFIKLMENIKNEVVRACESLKKSA